MAEVISLEDAVSRLAAQSDVIGHLARDSRRIFCGGGRF